MHLRNEQINTSVRHNLPAQKLDIKNWTERNKKTICLCDRAGILRKGIEKPGVYGKQRNALEDQVIELAL